MRWRVSVKKGINRLEEALDLRFVPLEEIPKRPRLAVSGVKTYPDPSKNQGLLSANSRPYYQPNFITYLALCN